MGDAGRLAPLRLTEPEANALSQALKRCKLDGDVRARISRALDPVQTSGHADRLLAGDALFGGFFPIIAEAISIGARMRMRYRTAGQSSPSERTIDPGFIEVSGDAAYLAAWDVEKDEQRSYRLDRIDDVVLTDDSVIDHPFARRSTAESLRDHGDTALIRWSSQQAFDSCTWAGLDRDRARTLEDGGRRGARQLHVGSMALRPNPRSRRAHRHRLSTRASRSAHRLRAVGRAYIAIAPIVDQGRRYRWLARQSCRYFPT